MTSGDCIIAATRSLSTEAPSRLNCRRREGRAMNSEVKLSSGEGPYDHLLCNARRGSGLDVPVFDPQEQNEQTPKVITEIGAALHVIADERFNALAAEQICIVDGRSAEGVH